MVKEICLIDVLYIVLSADLVLLFCRKKSNYCYLYIFVNKWLRTVLSRHLKCIGQFLIPKGKQKEEKFDAYYCCS